MRELAALLCLVTACGFEGSPGATPPDGDPAGEGPGAEVPRPRPCDAGFLNLCGLQAPTTDFFSTGTELDTDNDTRCLTQGQPGGPDLCLMYFRRVELTSGVLRVRGKRPLALVARDTMRILGTVDVSSRQATATLPSQPGAGQEPVGSCAFRGTPVASGQGAGGGAGGSLATAGGHGGLGNTNGTTAAGGMAGAQLPALTVLRGGCNGQEGAIGTAAPGGAHGLGGGAVYLGAASLHLTGNVLAGGSGGGASLTNDGGGGGGSGGVIVIEGGSLAISGTLIATGGGGGEGGSGASGGGAGGDAPLAGTPAPGGTQGGGGNGGAGATLAAGLAGADNDDGGGGGGGGTGFILLITGSLDTTGSTIVPRPGTRLLL